ncbi:hypothetical protein CUC08_Gglean000723 [Alternaria sp. MG1]|nr:hypothetical protein CUC08_Gglean000723 [Alternaria sp. MG1]
MVVHGGCGLCDLVVASGRGIDCGVLDHGLSHGLTTVDLCLISSISTSDVTGLLGFDGLTSVGACLTSLRSLGSLSWVGDRVVNSDILARDCVDTGLLVGGDLRLGSAVGVLVDVLRPLSALVLLDVNGLLLLALLVETGAGVSGKCVRTKLVVWHLLDLLVQLVPATLSAVLVGNAGGRSVAACGSGGVGDSLLGMVDNDRLRSLGDCSVVVVVVLDHSRHVGVLIPLGAILTAVGRRNAGWVRLVLGGHSDRLLAIAWDDGGVSDRLCGSARLDSRAGLHIRTVSAVGLVGSCSGSED